MMTQTCKAAPLVPTRLCRRQLRNDGRRRLEKALLINKRQQRNALPRKPLAIHVDLEVLRIEVQDRRVCISEEWPQGCRQRVATGSGQHAHELVERLKGLPQVEVDLHAAVPSLQI